MSDTQRDRERAREWFVAGRLSRFACPRCNAPGADIADKCPVALSENCPGWREAEEACRLFNRVYAKIVPEVEETI